MAENTRVRLEAHIETYLKSQSSRVLGKEGAKLTGAELTTITNCLLYEHKQLAGMARQAKRCPRCVKQRQYEKSAAARKALFEGLKPHRGNEVFVRGRREQA